MDLNSDVTFGIIKLDIDLFTRVCDQDWGLVYADDNPAI